ncbi:hypothetical protein H4R33_003622 [Dimargaris cristalligena]|uniref:30S ribosomal protein S6 n=1 Tax=Dimargaris cristalligena TaxID=215637 RepID=A0A4Q0A1I1_9FUNG|nr:hypothetical protein H4R33_003622 [Dimargaris cristalligena]RKP39638.1 30S ribosomal protein S6 [Dimargaris cristalligena]|eukprot:RKP39638.1 30S ribosomal protein S6 [Dimargaris cristalligena]
MPFYELLCISRSQIGAANIRDLFKNSALSIIDRGGVVRGISHFGISVLPHRIKRHQEYHERGRYWLMHFDCNPVVLNDLTKSLNLDPRVLRHNIVKMDSSLKTYQYTHRSSAAID